MHRRAEEINETTKQWVRHRGLNLAFDHAEVVKCDISATANTLKSQDTPNLLSPIQHSCRNAKVVLASTVVTGRNSSELKVSIAARQCQPASFNEGFYKVALICVFEARLDRTTS